MDQNARIWKWRVAEKKTSLARPRRDAFLHLRGVAAREDEEEELGSGFRSQIDQRMALDSVDYEGGYAETSKHVKAAQAALADREEAEAEAEYLRQELDEALKQGVMAEERLTQLDAALKECMDQIDALRKDHDERIQHAVSKATMEFEKEQKRMEGKLSEANRRLTNMAVENTHLTKALLCKETLIDGLDKRKAQVEAEFERLMATLESVEKENTFLKYECGMLEKELEIRNEEMECSRRTAAALQKQYLESVKEINMLELESRQLRILVRRMNAEINRRGEKGKERRRPSPILESLVGEDADLANAVEVPGEKDQLSDLEVENRTLKDIIAMRENELSSSMVNCAQTLSRLAQVEAQLKELSEGHNQRQLATCNPSDSSPGVSALEMEKLAIVAAETPDDDSLSHGFWLHEICRLILQEHRATKRSLSELVDDVKLALACGKNLDSCDTDITGLVGDKTEDSYPEINGLLTWAFPNLPPSNMLVEEAKGRRAIKMHSCSHEEYVRLKDELKTLESEMEIKLESAAKENEILMARLKESNESVEILRMELENSRETNILMEEQIDNQRLINEDLDAQLMVTTVRLSEILQKLSSVEMELEDRDNFCEELEATCLELQLQLETLASKGTSYSEAEREESHLKTEWEALASRVTIVGCQRSTQSPEKLKTESMEEASLVEKVVSSASASTTTGSSRSPIHHSSLRDRMLEEDNASKEGLGSPQTKVVVSFGSTQKPSSIAVDNSNALPDPIVKVTSYNTRRRKDGTTVGDLAIVPIKRTVRGFGLVRKLSLWRKKGSSYKVPVPLTRNARKLGQSRELLAMV